MTRTFAALTLLGLAGSVVATPPVPTASGIAGASASAAPSQKVTRETPFARPRAGAFITALDPDSRMVIPFASATKSPEVNIVDAQEVIVFAPHRPIRIHVSLQYEGQPIATMWRNKLKQAFTYFDRDKDGVLNSFEVQHIFSDLGLTQLLMNGLYQPTPQDRPTIERLDLDGDRRVSFEEFVAYYKSPTNQILRPVAPQAENPTNAAATEALFKLLDDNGDGKLTRDEVRKIETFLATLDADEDECLSLGELVPGLGGQQQFRGQVVLEVDALNRPPSRAASQTVNTYEVGRIPGTLTQQLIKRYDKDGDFELSREECKFDEPTFTRLDTDGNGSLDGEELDVWRTGPADLQVAMSLAPKAAECVARLVTDIRDVEAHGFSVKQSEPGRLVLRSGRQPIEFWAPANLINGQPSLKQQYQYLFQQAANNRDFVLEKELSGPNAVQFQFLRTMFDPADANSDGRLTRAEFDNFFDLQDSFRNVALAVIPAIQTPTLFQLLDENRDGRLGVRELRTAWDRLLTLEPSNSDMITRAAIQPSVSLRLGRGQDRNNVVNQVVFVQEGSGRNNGVIIPQKGPMWFRKMDRNADGDVSRSEYLGTKAEFDSIDTDHDGLISLQEAEAFDKKMRKEEEKR